MSSIKVHFLLLLFIIPLFRVVLNAQENRTLPSGSFKLHGIIGESNIEKPEQKPQALIMAADVPKEQIKKECFFFGEDSLAGFDFDNISKLAKQDGAKMYFEFKTFMFESQVEFVKKKYNIKSLPFEIAEAKKIATPPFLLSGPCNNMDFENGNLAGWITSRGVNKNSNNPLTIRATPALTGTNQSIHACTDINTISSTYGNDPISGFPGLDPMGGNYSVRLGGYDMNTAGKVGMQCDANKYYTNGAGGTSYSNGEQLSQSFIVTAANALISYDYAVVLNDGGHKNGEQPYFHVSVTDSNGIILSPAQCNDYFIQADSGKAPPGFVFVGTNTNNAPNTKIYAQNWVSNSINLSSYIGQTVTIIFTAAGCKLGGHFAWAYIDVSCGPAQINAHSVCAGSTATLTAPPLQGGSYVWSGPAGGILSSTTGQTVVVDSNGTYSVTITPPQGATCKYTLTTTVNFTVMSSNISSVTNISCHGVNNGSATVSPSGGIPAFTYSWNPSAQTTATATGLGTGTYTVTVTDAEGCARTNTVAITQPNILKDTISTFAQSSCLSAIGSATDSTYGGTPGYTYLWTPGGQTTATATGLSPGAYSVHVTDANGCPSTSSAIIIIPAINGPTVTPSTSGHVLCNGGNDGSIIASISGGTAPFAYLWAPSGQTTSAVTGLAAGSYTITVMDANGCSYIATASVSQPSILTTGISATNISCHGFTNGSATVNTTGGSQPYIYLWDTSPPQNTQTVNNLTAGNYTVTVTDVHGCPSTSTVTIIEPPSMISSISSTMTQCHGDSTGSAIVSVTNGFAPYTYTWITNPVQNGTTGLGLPAGTYSVLVTDSHGCPLTQSVTITEPYPIAFTTNSSGYSCGSYGHGVATVSGVVGGSSPYYYAWSNGNTLASVSNLLSGSYIVTVTDTHGCIMQQSVSIPASVQPLADFTFTQDLSCEGISVQFTNKSQQATDYSWLFGDATTSPQQDPIHTYTSSGTFLVTLAVQNPPCVDTLVQTVAIGNLIPQNLGAANVFTPNGDGKNDCFTLVPEDTSATTSFAMKNCLSIEIFDRWGVKMFESSGSGNCWDGKNKKDNRPAVEGTYFYVAKIGETTIKGYVTLIR